jgi:hypothetical protein
MHCETSEPGTTTIILRNHESFDGYCAISAQLLFGANPPGRARRGFFHIVVMTTMRVMQADIEKQIAQLGSYTFAVNKWPIIRFEGPEGFERYWRRKDITLAQGLSLIDKATMPVSIGLETTFWGGEVETITKTAPNVTLGNAGVLRHATGH